jgi:predicted secreted Zn-dependent protease
MCTPDAGSLAAWRRSSRCTNSGCVEVAVLEHLIAVRDSKQTQSPVLTFNIEEWRTFIEGVKAGEFDGPAHAA